MRIIQDLLFETALKEEGIFEPNKGYRVHHHNATQQFDGKTYPFVFPKSFLNEVSKLDYTKTLDYFFAGTIVGPHRQFLKHWDKSKSLILTTTQNKFIHPSNDPTGYYKENLFNRDYFKQLASTKFALAPGGCSMNMDQYKNTGNFVWTYRFWEAVLVKAIPITNEPDKLIHSGYKFYSLDEEHVYREDWVEHNFNKLKKENFIWIED